MLTEGVWRSRVTMIVAPTSMSAESIAKFCQASYHCGMSTMNISLPESLRSFVDEQVESRGFGTSSEYVRELIRKDQDRLQLRSLLLAGAASALAAPADAAYFASLRERVRHRKGP